MHRIAQICVLFLWIHTLTFVKSQNQNCTLQSFLKSDKYDGNFDTTTLEDSYQSGRQVRVGCVVGYTGFYKLMCVNGKWQHKGTACQPRSCGHPGDAQFADFHLVEGDDFVFGSQVTYTCHKGYQMVSRKNYRTCLAGGWDGSVPVCEAQSCQSFDVPDGVVVNGDTQDATYGNVVRFSCRSNAEVLYGSSEMYCDENGQWVGNVPRCEAVKCTVPNIDNGYVPGGSQAQRIYNEHEILHFACNDLYKRAEDRPSKCTKIGDKAEFSPTPACEQIKCRLDQMSPTGTTYAPAYRNMFLPGETLTVTCGDTYYFSHFRETSAQVTCKEDGHWSTRPICREVICERRQPHVRDWQVWGQIKLNERASYSCAWNYKKTSPTGEATCTRDGWMPSPLCEEITCNRIDVDNADIDSKYLVYKNNQRATYRCKEGYKGNPTRTCGRNGWSGYSQCTEIKCNRQIVENADIVGKKFEYKYNEKAYYRCRKGFTGKPTLTCSANGWSQMSECEAVKCDREDFDHAASGHRRRTKYNYGQEVEFTCINGHVGSFTRTCGENGWTGSTVCSMCPKAEVKNGFVKPSPNDTNTVYYACNKGFKRDTKGWWGEAKCKGREWVGLDLCIEEEKCGEFPVIPNGAMSRHQTTVYENGQHVQIYCKTGYQPKVQRLTCHEGKWTSQWPSLETICASSGGNCKPPPVVENGVVETPHQDDYTHYSPVTYKCRENYMIEGGNRLYCIDGSWEEKNIKCLPLCDKPKDETMNFEYSGSERFRNGETLRYECVTSRESGTATCENGEWIKSVECEAPPAPPAPPALEDPKDPEDPAAPKDPKDPKDPAAPSDPQAPKDPEDSAADPAAPPAPADPIVPVIVEQ